MGRYGARPLTPACAIMVYALFGRTGFSNLRNLRFTFWSLLLKPSRFTWYFLHEHHAGTFCDLSSKTSCFALFSGHPVTKTSYFTLFLTDFWHIFGTFLASWTANVHGTSQPSFLSCFTYMWHVRASKSVVFSWYIEASSLKTSHFTLYFKIVCVKTSFFTFLLHVWASKSIAFLVVLWNLVSQTFAFCVVL